MRIISIIFVFSLLITPQINLYSINFENKLSTNNNQLLSIREINDHLVIIPSSDPYYGIIGSSIACWYDIQEDYTLLPLLVSKNGNITFNQNDFINKILKDENKQILVLGESVNTQIKTHEILGNPINVSLEAARYIFLNSSSALILPYGTLNDYELSLVASPLASYLNIPILLFNENEADIQNTCTILNIKHCFLVGDKKIKLNDIEITELKNKTEIQKTLINTIKEKFGEINYLTLTNPSDIIPPSILSKNIDSEIYYKENLKITLMGKEIDIIGNDTISYTFTLPDEINRIQISCKIPVYKKEGFYEISPIISMTLNDPSGKIAAYSSSLGFDIGEVYLDTISYNNPGNYKLSIKIYNGIKGGYFVTRGISHVNSDVNISVIISKLEKPHFSLIPNLSILAPYLTSAHGGLIISDSNFSITDNDYLDVANGSSSGPWYDEKFHNYNNQKVNYTIQYLKKSLDILETYSILEGYFNNHGWLGILADTNMIPMYYYGPSQGGIYESGLPSDNPYSLDWNLSVGRILSYDVSDVSLLISRTFFYEELCAVPSNQNDWQNTFNFIFGEGFGETGGLFHQVPYAKSIEQYGFQTNVYGDLRNSRQMESFLNIFTGANYIEYIGHGDWFWFTPSLYGLDYYGKAIDIAHAKEWVYQKPSIFLASACLMGRIDGIQPFMNIGLTMIHAGCNSFIGATRETGSEAGLETLENHLIIDDFSIGEALRGEKRIDKELPTYYVRTLYGDPAFNPYEPNNGFSNQGRPKLIS